MKTIKIIIIITSIILIGLFFKSHFDMKNELKQTRHNIKELIDDNKLNKTLYLTEDNFNTILQNENKKLLRLIKDSFNIKTKNIVRTFNNSYHHYYKDTVIQAQENDSIYQSTYNPDQCFKVDVKFSLPNKTFIFSDPVIDYNSETIYYWQRENKKGKKRPWPWKKRFNVTTINNCIGETKTEEIIFVK